MPTEDDEGIEHAPWVPPMKGNKNYVIGGA